MIKNTVTLQAELGNNCTYSHVKGENNSDLLTLNKAPCDRWKCEMWQHSLNTLLIFQLCTAHRTS